ncbi:Uncharacterised protein [Candidatus Venteria ishoeyi]|uniref:Uncharacterized protein n=1 Tax=Candidatus Venteria ishoeyi TaxID=1899563 RepID=A0A1H6F824_9GAMM|nr:Uncharacterised protein [Candidatus Venteria ishoeyi]
MPYLEPLSCKSKKTPVRDCWRYLKNRPDQFNYPKALEKGLPIGSGEIESGHRYVIQERLKLPGAWWKPEQAQHMLTLRINRVNHEWDTYWTELRMAA